MGTRFQRRIKIAPGVRVNIGKSGISGVTFGQRGASVSVGKRGTYANIGTPIPGLSSRTRLDGTSSRRTTPSEKALLIQAWDGVAVEPQLDDEGAVVFVAKDGVPAPDVVAREMHSQNAEAIAGWLDERVAELNAEREAIVNLHVRTPAEPLRFVPARFDAPAPTRMTVPELELPPETPPGCLGVIQRLLPGLRRRWEGARDAEVEELRRLHGAATQEADADHRTASARWEVAKREFDAREAGRRWLWEEGRRSDPEAVGEFLEQQLGQIAWPRETLVDFDFDVDDETLWLDVDLPEIEDLPDKEAVARGGAKGIGFKNRSATAVRKDYMTHVHGIGFLLVGLAFAALPSIEKVVVSGYSQRLDKATGRIGDEYLYSVRVDRGGWGRVDLGSLDRVDPVEALAAFDIRRRMTKTGVFRPIEPFARA